MYIYKLYIKKVLDLIEIEIRERNKIFEREREILFQEFENKNADIMNLIRHQRKLEQELSDLKNNGNIYNNTWKNQNQNNSEVEGINEINSGSFKEKENSSAYISNFDMNELENKVKSYGQKVLRKRNAANFIQKNNINNSSQEALINNENEIKKEINDNFNNYYLNRKQRYDINNRFNLFDIYLNIDYKKSFYVSLNNTDDPRTTSSKSLKDLFAAAEPITFYEIFNFKSVTKNDNGLIQNQLILIAKNDTLFAYDMSLNQLGVARFKEQIISLKTFKNQEGN